MSLWASDTISDTLKGIHYDTMIKVPPVNDFTDAVDASRLISKRVDFEFDFGTYYWLNPAESYIEFILEWRDKNNVYIGAGLPFKSANPYLLGERGGVHQDVAPARFAIQNFASQVQTSANGRTFETVSHANVVGIMRELVGKDASQQDEAGQRWAGQRNFSDRQRLIATRHTGALATVVPPVIDVDDTTLTVLQYRPATAFWRLSKPVRPGGKIRLTLVPDDNWWTKLTSRGTDVPLIYSKSTDLAGVVDGYMIQLHEIHAYFAQYEPDVSVPRSPVMRYNTIDVEHSDHTLTGETSVVLRQSIRTGATLVIVGFQRQSQHDFTGMFDDPESRKLETWATDDPLPGTTSTFTIDTMTSFKLRYGNKTFPNYGQYTLGGRYVTDSSKAYDDFLRAIEKDGFHFKGPFGLSDYVRRYPLFAFRLPAIGGVSPSIEITANFATAFTGYCLVYVFTRRLLTFNYDPATQALKDVSAADIVVDHGKIMAASVETGATII